MHPEWGQRHVEGRARVCGRVVEGRRPRPDGARDQRLQQVRAGTRPATRSASASSSEIAFGPHARYGFRELLDPPDRMTPASLVGRTSRARPRSADRRYRTRLMVRLSAARVTRTAPRWGFAAFGGAARWRRGQRYRNQYNHPGATVRGWSRPVPAHPAGGRAQGGGGWDGGVRHLHRGRPHASTPRTGCSSSPGPASPSPLAPGSVGVEAAQPRCRSRRTHRPPPATSGRSSDRNVLGREHHRVRARGRRGGHQGRPGPLRPGTPSNCHEATSPRHRSRRRRSSRVVEAHHGHDGVGALAS